tara:strand:- start:383 stop:931 length:549 start_codon:yes stop_codon:yes gene_type:complete
MALMIENFDHLNGHIIRTWRNWFIDVSLLEETATIFFRKRDPDESPMFVVLAQSFVKAGEKIPFPSPENWEKWKSESFFYMKITGFNMMSSDQWLLEMEHINKMYNDLYIADCVMCGKSIEKELLCDDSCCWQCTCEHTIKTYQPEEKDNNVPESYTCDECGTDLPIPEPDWDAIVKEDSLL